MTNTATYVIDNKEKMFKYESDPLFLDMISVIETISNAVVSEGNYRPYLLEYITEVNIVSVFTDVKLPTDINECYVFLHESGVVDTLRNCMPTAFDFIKKSAKELVDFKKESVIKRTKVDDLLDSLSHLIGTLNKEFEGLDMNDVLSRLEKVGFLPNMNESEIANAIINQIAKEGNESDKDPSDKVTKFKSQHK